MNILVCNLFVHITISHFRWLSRFFANLAILFLSSSADIGRVSGWAAWGWVGTETQSCQSWVPSALVAPPLPLATPPTPPTPHPAFPRRHPHLWPTGGTPQSTCQSFGRLPPTNCLLLPSDVHQLWTVLATTPLPVPALSFARQSRRTGQWVRAIPGTHQPSTTPATGASPPFDGAIPGRADRVPPFQTMTFDSSQRVTQWTLQSCDAPEKGACRAESLQSPFSFIIYILSH